MRIKQLLTKTLLAAAGLCVGASAWAGEVTTIYERGVSTAWSTDDYTTSALTANKWYSASTGNTGVSIATVDEVNYLHISARGKTTTGTSTLTLSRTANTIVTIDAVMNTGSSTFPSNDNRITFKYGAFTLNYYTRNSNAEYYINSTKTSLPALANNIDLTIHLVVNSIDGSISALKVTRGDTSVDIIDIKEADNKTFDAGTEYDTAVFEAYCNVSSNNTSANMKSFVVKQETQDVATADYTIKWAYANGTEIKKEVRNGAVGSTIGLTASDLESFFNADETVRYLCISNDLDGKTIGSDGNTIVTITVRDAEKWSWTVTTSYDETALPYTASGSVWEDLNTVYVAYPRYQLSGTQLVQKTPNSNDLRQSITVDKDGFTSDFAYSEVEGVDNIYLLSEAEELGTGLAKNGTTFTTRVSNGQIIYGSAGTLLTLPAGKYIFTLGTIGGDNNTHKVAYTVSAGSTQIASGTCTGNFLTNIVSPEFTLTGTTPITFTCSDPSSSRGIDLVYVQKTGDVELPATVAATLGANGYSTFASAYDLDLSSLSGVKAYTATLSGKELSFTECTDKVVAGTGLLLKGAADAEVALPVTATGAAAVAGNALTGVTTATALQSNAEGNYIFVMKKAAAASDELTFLPLTTESAVTVPAGKAYVSVPATAFAGGARALSVSFDDETTGINNVVTTMQQDGIYSLSGQRVMQPSKGLYIVNGKKVIIK